jgi:hypothetical protein
MESDLPYVGCGGGSGYEDDDADVQMLADVVAARQRGRRPAGARSLLVEL